MKRVLVSVFFLLTLACALASGARADAPPGWPSITTSFDSSTVAVGDTTPLTISLSGGDAAFDDLEILVRFPTGLNVSASSESQCGGTLTTTPAPDVTPAPGGGAVEISLDGGDLPQGGTCSFTVPVIAQSAGQFTVGTVVSLSRITSDGSQENDGYGTDSLLTVTPIAAPATVTSAFTPSAVAENGTTTWTVQIANPNASTALSDVRFFVNIPMIPTYLAPEAITGNSCGGTATTQSFLSPTTVTGPSVDYGGGSIPPGGQCVIAVAMTVRDGPGSTPVPVTVISNEGGTSATATATLTSLAPPAATPGPSTPVPRSTPRKAPSNTFTSTTPRIGRDATVTETMRVPGKGVVRIRETWRGKLIASAQKTVRTSSKLTIKLVPKPATRRALKSHRGATLKLLVAYTPTGGHTRTIRLTVRAALS